MRVRTNFEFNNMSREQVIAGLKNINELKLMMRIARLKNF